MTPSKAKPRTEALYRAERFDELVDLLRVDTIWAYEQWAVRALAAGGKKAEALRHAESCRSPWASDHEVDSVCEEILLSSGMLDEAYARYGVRANQAGGDHGTAAPPRPRSACARWSPRRGQARAS